MEEILSQLKADFSKEKTNSIEDMNGRIIVFKEYSKNLHTVLTLIDEAAQKLKYVLEPLKRDRIEEEEKLRQAREAITKEHETHTLRIQTIVAHGLSLEKDNDDKALKAKSLDDTVAGLTRERMSVENTVAEIRGENSTLARGNRELKNEEELLIASIEAKKKEDAELSKSIEDKKFVFQKLSTDAAVLEARAKK